MRRDLWPCLGLLEACLSPPVPRDHEEPALLSCSHRGLTSLLSQLSFVLLGVGADVTHSWGPGSSIRASTSQPGPSMPHSHCCPQGPGQGAAACRSVLPSDEYRQVSSSPWKHDAAPRALRGVSSWGHGGWFCCLWQLPLFWILHSPLQQPSRDRCRSSN